MTTIDTYGEISIYDLREVESLEEYRVDRAMIYWPAACLEGQISP